MPPEPPEEHFADAVLRHSSRRGFLERAGMAIIALAGVGSAARAVLPDDSDAYTNFCGHTFTTGNCPHPTGLPRVDRADYPLRASDGHAIDDLGRPIDGAGYPVDAHGRRLVDAGGEPLAPAPRSKVCPAAGSEHGLELHVQGSWYRCCGGRVRRLMDCCGYTSVRINGDAALTGYCYGGRNVFCVQYYETMVPC
ncbi:MAG TPA: hypothetical protein VII01_02330 [Solirubrobacteraceae bacterium]